MPQETGRTLCERTLDSCWVEVLEEAIDSTRGNVHDQTDWCVDVFTGCKLAVKDMALHEASRKGVPSKDFIPKLADAAGKEPQEIEIFLSGLSTASNVVPDRNARRI